MLQKAPIKYRSLPSDILVLCLVGSVIYALVTFGREWQTAFNPSVTIDLSASALPKYALFSALRGLCAFSISILFTFIVGYWAAKSAKAEKFIIPLLDIFQSVPVLGFLPGLVLALIAIFPKTNTGLELAAIIMIFTGQVWNMTFSFYSSLKSVPNDFQEVSKMIGLNSWRKLWRIEVPYSLMNLVWNSLMSLSGGWFFLSVCEAFTLGDQHYQLPGLGAYMSVASQTGNGQAMFLGILSMAGLIILMDIMIWRPVFAWAHQFRLEEVPGSETEDPLLKNLLKQSTILNWLTLYLRRRALRTKLLGTVKEKNSKNQTGFSRLGFLKIFESAWLSKTIYLFFTLFFLLCLVLGISKLAFLLVSVSRTEWEILARGAVFTLLRVLGCLIFGSVWTVPLAIWITTSSKRLKIALPLIQMAASFPAPMLYPLAVTFFLWVQIPFGLGSMLLMLLGAQWYILFNVLAGAMRIPRELEDAMSVIGSNRQNRWLKLYLPSIFPSLVTGWVTAAGGAWNASIVAEYLSYKGKILTTLGLGSVISQAAFSKNFSLLAASLAVMVIFVVSLNRGVWSKIYHLAQTRFRMDA